MLSMLGSILPKMLLSGKAAKDEDEVMLKSSTKL